jgi:hypothetical protein
MDPVDAMSGMGVIGYKPDRAGYAQRTSVALLVHPVSDQRCTCPPGNGPAGGSTPRGNGAASSVQDWEALPAARLPLRTETTVPLPITVGRSSTHTLDVEHVRVVTAERTPQDSFWVKRRSSGPVGLQSAISTTSPPDLVRPPTRVSPPGWLRGGPHPQRARLLHALIACRQQYRRRSATIAEGRPHQHWIKPPSLYRRGKHLVPVLF